MPRIVPLQLLRCLRVLLDNNGGILSAQEVKRISGLMAKYSKKLVSKCVYVQILKSTKTELLGDFMAVGGWSLVYTWLNDAIRAMNWPLVQEILELLLLSPVDVNRLKINSAPILVKGLCKDGGNEGVRILAKRLVEQWLKIVTENSCGSAVLIAQPAPQVAVTPAVSTGDSSSSSAGAGAPPVHDSASSSDSTDSAGAPVTYTITSAPSNSNSNSITIKWKSADKLNNDEDDDETAEATHNDEEPERDPLDTADLGKKSSSSLDDSCSAASEVKSGEDGHDNKKHSRSSKSDKSKRSSEKEREKDRKDRSSSSHRSSSSSHKSSSSSSSSSKSSSKSSSSSSSSSHRSSSDKHSRDKDKDKARSSSGSSSSKDKERSGSSSSSSSSSNKHKSSKSSSSSSSSSSSTSSSGYSSSKDRKDKSSSSTSTSSSSSSSKQEKDKDNKLMPPPTAAPAASPSVAAAAKEGEPQKPRSIPIMSRKASISIEIRRDTEKASTVKTYQSKFRSHGLTEEAPPPPSRKGLKKPTSTPTTPSTSMAAPPVAPAIKRPSPPPRDSPAEKKPKIDMSTVAGHVERPGAAKLIAPKKISTLVETNLFSDALAASIEPKKTVKRKRVLSATSPTDKDAPLAPLKFYQDTLDESKGEEKSDDSTKENEEGGSPSKDTDGDDDDIPLKRVKEHIEQKVKEKEAAAGEAGNTSDDADDTPAEPKKPGPGCGPDGPPGVLVVHRRKGPKKKLTWQPEDKLTQIRYFEVDHSERVNVTKQSFNEMKNMERFSERDALTIARRGFDDTMEPQMEWRALVEVDNVPDHPNGNLSKQRQVQADREATTLRALYFSPDMIPDSAAEAELEPHFAHDIPVIPMDDLTGNPDAVNDYSALPWPEPKGYGVAAPGMVNGVNSGPSGGPAEMGFGDMNTMMPPPNMMPPNPFDPFICHRGPPGIPAPNLVPNGPPQIWQNPMVGPPPPGPPMMNGPGPGPGMDMNGMNNMNNMPPPPQGFMGNQFGSPVPPFGAGPPPGFNQFPPMMMNGPGPGPGMGPGPGPMMNGPPNGMGPGPGPMQNRNNINNNNRNKNNVGGGGVGGGGGGNWRSGGNNFQDNSGGNWRSAGSGSNNRGGNGVCKQFMRGHCNMGKNCKYVHPQKKRM